MRRLPAAALLCALLSGGCAGSRTAERRELRGEAVGADSFRAIVADDLLVRLHEVVITPLDSPRMRVEIKEVELRRERDAEVESGGWTAESAEATAEIATEKEAAAGGWNPLQWLTAGCVVVLLIKLWWRSGR